MDTAILNKIPLFEGPDTAQLEKIVAITSERSVESGEKIFKESDASPAPTSALPLARTRRATGGPAVL